MEAAAEMDLPPEVELYAAAYRPVQREERPEIDVNVPYCLLLKKKTPGWTWK